MQNMQRKHKAAVKDEKRRTFTVGVLISHRMSNRNARSEDQILTQMFILSLSGAFFGRLFTPFFSLPSFPISAFTHLSIYWLSSLTNRKGCFPGAHFICFLKVGTAIVLGDLTTAHSCHRYFASLKPCTQQNNSTFLNMPRLC